MAASGPGASSSKYGRGQGSKSGSKHEMMMDLPERLQHDDDDDDEDITRASEDHPETYIQQSVYGIIAAAQSRGQFQARFEAQSASDSDSEWEERAKGISPLLRTSGLDPGASSSSANQPKRSSWTEAGQHGNNKSGLEEVPQPLSLRSGQEIGDTRDQDPMSQSQILPPKDTSARASSATASSTSNLKTVSRDRKSSPLVARDLASSVALLGTGHNRAGAPVESGAQNSTASSLSRALAEIFQFDRPEDVVAEYPCWYLQSVLLQGYLYITQRHICFYAYLPKKGNTLKSGYLAKQGKHSSRYQRCWFTLKGNVLTYFSNAADPYFPSGTIDLRSASSADLVPEKSHDDSKGVTAFTITTDKRTYSLRAESSSSAKEWVRHLQRIIFRSHNEGDSVKICILIDNVVDVEPSPVSDVAETVRIRVIDNDETYAVDEYFFTFFNNGADALHDLMLLAQRSDNSTASEEDRNGKLLSRTDGPPDTKASPTSSPNLISSTAPRVPSTVLRSTSPLFPGLADSTLRKTLDKRRNSKSRGSYGRESAESFNTSSEYAPAPSAVADEAEVDMSASQILTGDTAFRSPTLRNPQPNNTTPKSSFSKFSDQLRGSNISSTSTIQPLSGATASTKAKAPNAEPGAEVSEEHNSHASNQRHTDNSHFPEASSSRSSLSITTPLQQAFNLAGAVRDRSKRMSSYLSSSPKNYYDKFSGAIAGGKRHYTDADHPGLEDNVDDPELEMETAEHERRFQEHFALPKTEKLRAVYYCWLHRVLPLYGKIYVSDRRFCFRSLLYGTRTKLVVPFQEMDNVTKEKGFRWGYPGMVLVIRGYEELFFDFGDDDVRDDCVVTVLRRLNTEKTPMDSSILTEREKTTAEVAAAENKALQGARESSGTDYHSARQSRRSNLSEECSVLFDDPASSVVDFRPKKALRVTCLTIGSRGDVQPYIALCKGLMKEGHSVKIATHTQFEGWIRKHGVDFVPVNGDPAELMRMCVENGMFTPSFFYEANTKFRTWLDDLLKTSWGACQNSDVLIESPSAMAGIHIAEALGIPYFRAFTMPWTKTRAYPHAFAAQGKKMGGQYNYTSYTIFDYVFWQAIAMQINRWRRNTLNLTPTDLTKLQSNKVPFLYNFSPSVVPPPLDFSDWIRITGYWFLDEAEGWQPPEDLLAFIKKARSDGRKLVYIGFGSVPVSDSKGLTQQILDAVLKSDVRCILSKGWSDHFTKEDPSVAEVKLPPAVFQIRSAPHDWLFRQIDAAVHHGGAGTTGASLRAGVPTVVKPFFGDQFFFATRVEDLGVGIHLKKITVNALGKALWWATHDERMRIKAKALGEQIRRETGVNNAINAIYRDLEYAKTLIKKATPAAAAAAAEDNDDDEEEDTEESWTFIENDSDVDVTSARRRGEAWDVAVATTPSHPAAPGHARQHSLTSMVFGGKRIIE